jgi:apolipoprotein D and lipocalin family protein
MYLRQIAIARLMVLLLTWVGSSMALSQTPGTYAAAGNPAGGPNSEALVPIASIDIDRYMGRWYEVAKFSNWFQRRCVSDTRAEYQIAAAGAVKVLNRCRNESGEFDEASGMARQIGDATSPRLKVRFAPDWLSFLPFVWGDYWVIDLDADYHLVAVSEPKREYLWILSRTPQPDAQQYAALLDRLRAKGLDVGRLETTRHGPPE